MRIEPFISEVITISDVSSDGPAVARIGERVVFVEGGVPGDRAEVHVFAKEKKVLLGRIHRLEEPSPFRVEPICEHFGTCGGCKRQHIDYHHQLFLKEKQVKDAFERIAKVNFGKIFPIIGCDEPLYYRNKVDFACSAKRWFSHAEMNDPSNERNDVIGFHVPRHFDKVVEIRKCYLTKNDINEVRNAIQRFARQSGFTFYDARTHEGWLRNLVFRTSEGTGEIMLILVIAFEFSVNENKIISFIKNHFPQITSFVTIINTKLNDSYTDLPYFVRYGTPYITEKLDDYQYRIGPLSFFQTNTRQAERLYRSVKEAIPSDTRIIYDMYCGAGSIGIFVSDKAEKIIGIEYVPSAVEDALVNVQLNEINHLQFFAGDMAKILTSEFIRLNGTPDVVITDPPRAGMDVKVLQTLLNMLPKRIIYVSCNPATQARDVAMLAERYDVQSLQPVDMFPQTTHVENIAVLDLNR